jgi:hypothetical protein
MTIYANDSVHFDFTRRWFLVSSVIGLFVAPKCSNSLRVQRVCHNLGLLIWNIARLYSYIARSVGIWYHAAKHAVAEPRHRHARRLA